MDSPFSLTNKTIIVTGASSGLGRSTAIEISKAGGTLILLGRNLKRLKETEEQLKPGSHQLYSFDLNDSKEVDVFVSTISKVDGIINSAGIGNTQLFNFLKEDSLRSTLDTNFFAPIMLNHKLVKSKKINKKGSIVFISSISGPEVAYPGNSAYSASKAALTGIAKAMALELATKKIRVNCLLPGMIRTELLDNITPTKDDLKKDETNYPLGYGTPKDVAYAAVYLLSEASKWITGTNLKLDGGLTIK